MNSRSRDYEIVSTICVSTNRDNLFDTLPKKNLKNIYILIKMSVLEKSYCN